MGTAGDAVGSRDASPRARLWPALGLVAAIAAVLLVLLIAGTLYLRREQAQGWRERLATTASYQERLVRQWLDERAADAAVVASYPSVRAGLGASGQAADPGAVGAESAHLSQILDNVRDAYHYDGVWVVDRSGRVVVRRGGDGVAEEGAADLQRAAIASSTGVARPLAGRDGRLLFGFAAPVRRGEGFAQDASGAVLMLCDPGVRLWPLLDARSTGTRSGEIVLVRHGGDALQLLSPLRGRPEPGALLSAAATRPPDRRHGDDLAALFDVPVLTARRPIPGTDWEIVVKVERAEANETMVVDLWGLSAMVGLVILAAVGVGVALSRREQARALTAELSRERALQHVRERSEREIRRLNAELEQRVRERTAALETANRELEAFNYSVSHDLRAPLRQIGGYLSILTEDFGPQLNAEARGYMARVAQASRRMSELIDALLQLSRIGRAELDRQPVDLAAVAHAAFADLRPQVNGRQIDFRVHELPTVSGDLILLRQLFANLIANAVKFTRTKAHAHIEVGTAQVDGRPTLFVRDDGVGFDPQYAGKLFGVFQRLHSAEEFEGNGVGLSIVKRIVEKHGGAVWAEGRPDHGATVYFTLM